jgi:hypothetical protein
VNIDPAENLVVFDLGDPDPYVVKTPTRAEDGIQRAWFALPVDHGVDAGRVTRIYSEWQPSAADADFIRRTFPTADVTYTFPRPGPDGWDAAFAEARQVMAQAAADVEAQHAADAVEHVNSTGEMLPVLWSRSSPKAEMLAVLPHREVVPGRLYVTVATVAPTPQGTIGMVHLTAAGLGDRSFEDALAESGHNLARGLRVDGYTDPDQPDRGYLLVLRRDGTHTSSAVVLPDFHAQMSTALGDTRLLVGLPDPDTILVTRQDSGWADDLQQAVLTSTCPAGELVPTVLAAEPSGLRVVAERPA